MKIRFFAAMLIAALVITAFSGCGAALQRLDHAQEVAEDKLEAIVEDRLEPDRPAAAPETAAGNSKPAELLTEEEVIAIALKDAGFSREQVSRLKTEFDYDDGRPEYEVDFHVDLWEYDYEIDAETGRILSFDKDRDD